MEGGLGGGQAAKLGNQHLGFPPFHPELTVLALVFVHGSSHHQSIVL